MMNSLTYNIDVGQFMKNTKRDLSIDALKAFAIYLVVLGHFIQYSVKNFDENLLFKLIYSFHMPLFIFISGYLSYREKGIDIKYLKRRFLTLLIPYFSWMVVSSIINVIDTNDGFFSSIIRIFLYPDNGLWFLWVLFWMHILFYCCSFLSKKYLLPLMCLSYLLIRIVIYVLKIENVLGVNLLSYLFLYFIFGFVAVKYKNFADLIFKSWYFALPFFLFMACFWQRIGMLSFDNYLINSKLIISIYKIIVATLGIITSVGVFREIKSFNKYIIYTGENSIAIYTMNMYVLSIIYCVVKNILHGYLYYFYAVSFSFIIIFICLFIGNLLKKNKFLSLIFLGNQ